MQEAGCSISRNPERSPAAHHPQFPIAACVVATHEPDRARRLVTIQKPTKPIASEKPVSTPRSDATNRGLGPNEVGLENPTSPSFPPCVVGSKIPHYLNVQMDASRHLPRPACAATAGACVCIAEHAQKGSTIVRVRGGERILRLSTAFPTGLLPHTSLLQQSCRALSLGQGPSQRPGNPSPMRANAIPRQVAGSSVPAAEPGACQWGSIHSTAYATLVIGTHKQNRQLAGAL